MKNIIDIYEASLLGDIEDTLNDGNNYIESINSEFKRFYKGISNPNYYYSEKGRANDTADLF